MTDESRKVKLVIFSVFFLFIIVYGFLRSTDLLFGVKIRGVNITDGASVNESVMKITGNARNAINLALNAREISIDLEGDFEETVALLPVYNMISIRAVDKFGYEDEKNYKLILTK